MFGCQNKNKHLTLVSLCEFVFPNFLQVLTRLLFSSCPVLYWYCTYLISNNTPMEPECNRYDVTQSQGPSVELKKSLDSSKTNVLIHQIQIFKNEPLATRLMFGYFLCYFVIGTALFSNFLPWT